MNLSRPCDACGKPIGDAYKHCSKCNIYLCFICGYILQNLSNEYPAKVRCVVKNLDENFYQTNE